MISIWRFIFFAALFNGFRAEISEKCLQCISEIEGGDKLIGKCNWDVNSLSCGPFQIKKLYWIDCGKLGTSWKQCGKDKNCSKNCVKKYMKRYGKYCTGKAEPTCEEYGRIHNGGPKGCQKSATLHYGEKIKRCMSK